MAYGISSGIVITNIDLVTTAILSPQVDGVKEPMIDIKLNGESTFEFYLPVTSEKLAEITPECRIYPGNLREYIIQKDEAIDIIRDEKGAKWAKIMAVESFYELNYEFVTVRNDGEDESTHNVTIVSGGDDLSGGLYDVGSAGHALYALLDANDWGGKTPWTVGTVDVTGTFDLETNRFNLLQNIKKIQELWGGYLVWDSMNHTVSLRAETTWQIYRGANIRYAKNLKNITRTQSNKIITRLYVYGADDLSIADVNNGDEYLEDYTYSSNRYTEIVQNPDIYDQDQLLAWGQKELAKVCQPRNSYTVKMVDPSSLEEYYLESIDIGDLANVYDADLQIDEKLRIARYSYDPFQPWNCTLGVGDPSLSLEEMIAGNNSASSFISDNVSALGKLNGLLTIEGMTILLNSGTILTWDALPEGVLGEDGFTTIAENWISTRKVKLSELTSLNEANPIIFLFTRTGTAQAGTSDSITLIETESSTDDNYNDLTIQIISGTGSGQERVISDYDGTTKVATVDDAWDITPDNTSVYLIKGPSLDATYQFEQGIGNALRVRWNKYAYTRQSANDLTFYFKDDNDGNRPIVKFDGFYLGNRKFASVADAVAIVYKQDGTGFDTTIDGTSDSWVWTKDGNGRIIEMESTSGRSITVDFNGN